MQTIKGDIFKLMQPGDAMMHGCNAQGVMGSGIARTVRELFPGAYNAYRRHYELNSGLQLGEVIPYTHNADLKMVLNCITQEFYGADGRRYVSYDAISKACKNIREGFGIMVQPPEKLYCPLIGAVLAGGDWRVIKEILRGDLFEKLSNTELIVVEFDRG